MAGFSSHNTPSTTQHSHERLWSHFPPLPLHPTWKDRQCFDAWHLQQLHLPDPYNSILPDLVGCGYCVQADPGSTLQRQLRDISFNFLQFFGARCHAVSKSDTAKDECVVDTRAIRRHPARPYCRIKKEWEWPTLVWVARGERDARGGHGVRPRMGWTTIFPIVPPSHHDGIAWTTNRPYLLPALTEIASSAHVQSNHGAAALASLAATAPVGRRCVSSSLQFIYQA